MLDSADLFQQARRGATLVAPNLRAARQLRLRIAAHAATPEEAASLSDRVLHWRGWVSALWQEVVLQGWDERVLLDPMQERLLWEQVLDQDHEVERTEALLDLCISATALLYQGRAREAFLAERHSDPLDDTARFARWFRIFERRCYDDLLLPPSALEEALSAVHAPLAAGETVVLCGLADVTRAQTGLLTFLEQSGTVLIAATQRIEAARPPCLLRCRDDQDELRALTQHLIEVLQAASRPSIAVIVPDLSSVRDRVDRTLREHVRTADDKQFTDERRPLWEFSTGRPLVTMGVIADALHLLTWSVRELEAGELSSLLRSPHLDWPADTETFALLDAALLRKHPHLRSTWSFQRTAHSLELKSPALAATIRERAASWNSLRHSSGSFSSFAERARDVLRQFGWFHARERTSTEFQAVTRFQALLDKMATLDLVAGAEPTWPAFVQRLSAAARSTSFARENTGAPVQFLTPEESTGVEAEELWLLHADENHWSGHATPHPLLSWPLQQRHGMAGVEPDRDEARFREQVHRVTQLAPVATFSYAHAGITGEQRPCPQLIALPGIDCRDADPAGIARQVQASAQLQSYEDGAFVPFSAAGRADPIPGGVSVLQSQAACAFRAFAERRLGSATLQTRDLGLDARDRGSLLHDALQIFWRDTNDSKALLRLISDGKLASAIHHAVTAALHRHREANDRWAEAYLDVERTRLESLLDRWLRVESERPPFRIVALEREVTVTVGGLPLKVRVDRIDEVTLGDGTQAHIILDYKTGLPSAKSWEGDRPDEPQLPLYATSALSQFAESIDVQVGAIAFGVVRAGETLEFITAPPKSAWLSSEPKASTATLHVQLDGWRRTLQTLAEDFRNGIATVGPKEYPSTCRYCEQRLLCRLNPALLTEDMESEAGE